MHSCTDKETMEVCRERSWNREIERDITIKLERYAHFIVKNCYKSKILLE